MAPPEELQTYESSLILTHSLHYVKIWHHSKQNWNDRVGGWGENALFENAAPKNDIKSDWNLTDWRMEGEHWRIELEIFKTFAVFSGLSRLGGGLPILQSEADTAVASDHVRPVEATVSSDLSLRRHVPSSVLRGCLVTPKYSVVHKTGSK